MEPKKFKFSVLYTLLREIWQGIKFDVVVVCHQIKIFCVLQIKALCHIVNWALGIRVTDKCN